MMAKITFLCESFKADLALEWPFFSVDAMMVSQICIFCEDLPTAIKIAFVRRSEFIGLGI